jgi:hypothetical protein
MVTPAFALLFWLCGINGELSEINLWSFSAWGKKDAERRLEIVYICQLSESAFHVDVFT